MPQGGNTKRGGWFVHTMDSRPFVHWHPEWVVHIPSASSVRRLLAPVLPERLGKVTENGSSYLNNIPMSKFPGQAPVGW